jgi:hypothetical protein
MEGICPQCGLHYFGWALNTEHNQMCVKCGSALEIRMNDIVIRSGHTCFKAEQHKFGSDQDHWEDLRNKNLLFYLTLN